MCPARKKKYAPMTMPVLLSWLLIGAIMVMLLVFLCSMAKENGWLTDAARNLLGQGQCKWPALYKSEACASFSALSEMALKMVHSGFPLL